MEAFAQEIASTSKMFGLRVDGVPPPSENALLYETVSVVDGSPILRDMVFSPDYQYIYLLSDKQVSRLPVESCSQYSSCESCLGSGDPHCGWCVLHNKESWSAASQSELCISLGCQFNYLMQDLAGSVWFELAIGHPALPMCCHQGFLSEAQEEERVIAERSLSVMEHLLNETEKVLTLVCVRGMVEVLCEASGIRSCSRKEACEKWSEPLHFSTDVRQCVDITVTPDNMSVTSTSTQVTQFYMPLLKQKSQNLNVKVANVPNLSAGVTCVFEELSESPGEVLARGQILCMAPSLRDAPLVSHGYGDKRVVKLSLKSKETGLKFITTDFIFYNCSVLQSQPEGKSNHIQAPMLIHHAMLTSCHDNSRPSKGCDCGWHRPVHHLYFLQFLDHPDSQLTSISLWENEHLCRERPDLQICLQYLQHSSAAVEHHALLLQLWLASLPSGKLSVTPTLHSLQHMCSSCVSSPFPCNWCKYRHICTNNVAECSFQEGRVSSAECGLTLEQLRFESEQQNLMKSPSESISAITCAPCLRGCPQILPSTDILVPAGIVRPITLRARNLPQPQSGQKNYECVFNIQGKVQRIPAVRFNSSCIQCQNTSPVAACDPSSCHGNLREACKLISEVLRLLRLWAQHFDLLKRNAVKTICYAGGGLRINQYGYQAEQHSELFREPATGDFEAVGSMLMKLIQTHPEDLVHALELGAGRVFLEVRLPGCRLPDIVRLLTDPGQAVGSLTGTKREGEPEEKQSSAGTDQQNHLRKRKRFNKQTGFPRNTGAYWYEGNEMGDLPVDFSIVWDGDFPIDKPSSMRALLYKCEAQRDSCGLCLKAESMFDCGWCLSERKCLLKQHCSSAEHWMHQGRRNIRCSHPRITKIRPLTGPKEGGTRVTIEGENLGLQVREITHVRVAGVRCNPAAAEYISAERIVCDMEESLMSSPPGGPVELCIGDCSAEFRTQSSQTYSFVTPSFGRVRPEKGPVSGGTRLTISGRHLDAGSAVTVFLAQEECLFVRYAASLCRMLTSASLNIYSRAKKHDAALVLIVRKDLYAFPMTEKADLCRRTVREIVCVTPTSASGSGASSIRLLIDKAEVTSDTRFIYTEDPSIGSIDPNWSIINGSTILTVTGSNLLTIQEPKVRAKYGGVETTNVCTVVNDSVMTCLAPGIVYTKRQAPESGLHPDEFGFILDHVSALLILNGTPFTYYPNPTFDPLGNAGILEVKPGSPIILKA
ncbi:hypothetical protein DNTS_009514 [Danionella cerebrum]|uniref:Sema domain-containing protein n=1 Tax=Danionella cerebrum TaxID=2873325 RepID=A0A553P549_9TELE|nr:hypothetical protein DNTS_009514 [Danionella translucida]